METVVVERMARYDDREKPVSKDLHTLASSLESCRVATGEKISPRCTRVLWRDLYAQCTTAASTWEHGYVAISAVSLLSSARPGKNCPTPHPSRSTFRAGERKMIGGARGERHAIAMLEIDQWVFLALLAVRLAAWLRIYCVSIFRGTTIVRSNAFIVALVPLVRAFPWTRWEWKKRGYLFNRKFTILLI